MKLFDRKYSPQKEIELIQKELSEIGEIKELLNNHVWKQVDLKFRGVVESLNQEIFDLSKKAQKNAYEIEIKRWVAEYISGILYQISQPIQNEELLKQQEAKRIMALRKE